MKYPRKKNFKLLLLTATIFVLASCKTTAPSQKLTLVENNLPATLLGEYQAAYPLRSELVFNDEVVVFQEGTNLLTALKLDDASVIWSYESRAYFLGGVKYSISDDSFVGVTGDDRLFLLDPHSGKTIWESTIPVRFSSGGDTLLMKESVIVAGRAMGKTFVGSYSLIDGAENWTLTTYFPPTSYSSMFDCSDLSKNGEELVCVVFDRQTYLINVKKGQIHKIFYSHFFMPDEVKFTYPTLLLTNARNGNNGLTQVQRFNMSSETEINFQIDCSGDLEVYPVIFEGMLFIFDQCGNFYQSELHTDPKPYMQEGILESALPISFVESKGTGYVLTQQGEIVSLELATGNHLGKAKTDLSADKVVTFYDSSLYANSSYLFAVISDTNVFVFETQEP